MDNAAKTQLIAAFCSLIYLSSNVPAQSQLADEVSVPEPTQLHTAAHADGSILVLSELLGEIDTADSTAAAFLIEVENTDGERIRGVKISLKNSTSADAIYIPVNLLSSFQDELREIEFWRHRTGKCQARVRCVQGIARCRPAGTEKQAYCPGRFSTPRSEGGFILSTPRNTFSFPTVEATRFEALIGDAIRALQ